MPKLRKIGLWIMLVGLIIAVGYGIFEPTLETTPHQFIFDMQTFLIIALPAIIVTSISLIWPPFGGFLAAVGSLVIIIYSLRSIIGPTLEPMPDYFWGAITLCYLVGSVLIFISYGSRDKDKNPKGLYPGHNAII